MVGWRHQFNGHELGQTPGDGDRQESLVCCCPRGRRVGRDLATEQQQQLKGGGPASVEHSVLIENPVPTTCPKPVNRDCVPTRKGEWQVNWERCPQQQEALTRALFSFPLRQSWAWKRGPEEAEVETITDTGAFLNFVSVFPFLLRLGSEYLKEAKLINYYAFRKHLKWSREKR